MYRHPILAVAAAADGGARVAACAYKSPIGFQVCRHPRLVVAAAAAAATAAVVYIHCNDP